MAFVFCLAILASTNASIPSLGEGGLELIDFTVVQNLNKIDIRWSTSVIKTGGPYFCIEKSKDGKNFTKLVDMPATANEASFADYFETDYQPYSGVSYYRVKQVDAAGNFRYSQVVTLKIEEEKRSDTYEVVAGINGEDFKVINEADPELLLVLRDKNGMDHYSKAVLNKENNTNVIKLASPIEPGTYQVVGSSNEKLHCLNVLVK